MSTLTDQLTPHLDADARHRLDDLVRELDDDPSRISVLFPAVGRRVARGPSEADDPDGIRHPRLEDEARVALLATLAAAWRDRPERFDREMAQLYRYGDADEKRGVLRALSAIHPDPGRASLPLVDDALRTNDVRLVAAAGGREGPVRGCSAAGRAPPRRAGGRRVGPHGGRLLPRAYRRRPVGAAGRGPGTRAGPLGR